MDGMGSSARYSASARTDQTRLAADEPPLHQVAHQRSGPDDDAILALALAVEECTVGALHERLRRVARRELGEPDAERDFDRVPVGIVHRRFDHALHDALHTRRRERQRDAGREDAELVAAEAADDVAAAERGLEALR